MHDRSEVLDLLKHAQVGTIATVSGDKMRTRMMHFAVDDKLRIYLATMTGDPKTLQVTHHPGLSILVYFPAPEFNDSQEVEYTGVAHFVRDPGERAAALELTAQKSPVVKYLNDTGAADVLDFIRVEPQLIKLRVFKEIVQGMPPTVIDFPDSAQEVNEWQLLKHKATNWYRELRPSFLTAALIPVLMGAAIAFSQTGESFHWGYFALTLVAGLFIQGGANTINDYFDHKNGTDTINRDFVRPFSGGSRLIQLGLLTPTEVLGLSLLCFLVSSGIGIYLTLARGPLVLLLGFIGMVSAVFYTGKPFYWAKRGIGEVLVGINFGPLMSLGAYYVQTQSFSWLPAVAALPVGLLITAVLFINEFPDYQADKACGKYTWIVRLGLKRGVLLFATTTAAAILALATGIVLGYLPRAALLALIAFPAAVIAVRYAAASYARSFDLAPANALTIIMHLTVGLAITWAFILQGAPEQVAFISVLGAAFATFIAYMYWHVEHQKRIFHGLKGMVAGK